MSNSEEIKLISFLLDEKEYAININFVQEIIAVQEIVEGKVKTITITTVPKSPEYMKGVIDLRGHIIPIINLRKILGLEEKEGKKEEEKIVIIEIQDIRFGILIDSVKEVLNIHKFDIEPVPQFAEKEEKIEFLEGVVKLKDRLVLLFNLNKILKKEQFEEIKTEEKLPPAQQEEVDKIQIISFFIGDEYYGLEIKYIQEIIIPPKITKVPNTPPFLKGIINLRGNIIPVIDVKEFLGLPKKVENATSSRIIVTTINGDIAGLIIDAVHQVMKISKENIEPSLYTLEEKKAEYITGIVKEKSGILILINFEKLIQDIKTALEK
jgi:purine-binding chemotaxis protein CheW